MAKKNLRFLFWSPESPEIPGFFVSKIAKGRRATYQEAGIFHCETP
ncbi:MAG: hypothetical protein QM636_25630 [Rhizobium sp.]